jgi:hypothetical protein
MEEKNRKFPLNTSEVVLLIMFIPILFYVAMRISVLLLNSPGMPDWLFGPIGPLAVIGFDVLWLISMKLPLTKSKRIKIYPTLLILTFSASVLGGWTVLKLLSGMRW